MLKVGMRWRDSWDKVEINKKEEIFNTFLQLIYKYPLRGINQKCIKQGYMDVARKLFVEDGYDLSESFEKIVDIIEHDYRQGFLKYKTYWRLKKFYKELIKKAKEFEMRYLGRTTDMEQLLLRFLNAVVSLDSLPEKLNAMSVADLMGVDLETANKFIKWLKKSEYDSLARFVIKTKRQEIALKQHSVSKQ